MGSSFRRAILLSAATSVVAPLAGILVAPMLAQGLGVAGRGVVAAAVAPNILLVGIATLGLPEALTFLLAKYPRWSRWAVFWCVGMSTAFGLLAFCAVWLCLPFLSSGDAELGTLVLFATALAVPTLAVNVLRGAAAGRQMWTAIAAERIVNGTIRIVGIGSLFVVGQLTVASALLIGTVSPIVSGLAYWRLLRSSQNLPGEDFEGSFVRAVSAYGWRIWFGSVAGVLLARVGQMLFAPLSNVTEFGIYVVAVTISDVPWILALAIRDAMFGVSSRQQNVHQVTFASRSTLLVASVGCLTMGASLPLWIGLLFGSDFVAAVPATLILMLAALVSIPGSLAIAALGAWGRPGLRSIGIALSVLINVPLFVLLLPSGGAIGAGIAALVSNLFLTAFTVVAAARVLEVRSVDFFSVRFEDMKRLGREVVRIGGKIRSQGSGSGANDPH